MKAAAPRRRSRRAASSDYRVFVPIDAQRKPTGGKVYLPEAFYQELYRRAALAEKPPAWLIAAATYRGELARDAATGRWAIGTLRAEYDLRVLARAARVRIPLGLEGAELSPAAALVDGRAIHPQWEPGAAALTIEGVEPGRRRLEFSLRPTMHDTGDAAGIDLAIPRVAASRLELMLPADAPPVEAPSACGGWSLEKEPSRLVADLGPADRLTVRWHEGATASQTSRSVDAEQLLWLKIQPGSVVVAAKFRFHATAGRIQEVQLAVDSRLRLLPMPGDEPPSVEIAAESDQTRVLTFRWPRPLSDQATLEATFLMGGASGVGKIRLPRIELLDARSTRRWLAVSVDAALDSRPAAEGFAGDDVCGRLSQALGQGRREAANRLSSLRRPTAVDPLDPAPRAPDHGRANPIVELRSRSGWTCFSTRGSRSLRDTSFSIS